MDVRHTLSDAEIFLTVVTENGFTAASRRLGVAQSTLSRRMRALEERLSAQLMVRTTRKIALTDMGHLYLEKCRAIVPLLIDAEQSVAARATEPEGTVRIVAPTSVGRARIVPLLTEFCRRYPRLAIDGNLVDRHVNLIDEGFDIAIMLGDLPDSSFVKRSLGDLPLKICGSPDYLARHGVPTHPDDLKQHQCIFYRGNVGRLDWRFVSGSQNIAVTPTSRLSLNDTSATLVAAVSGAGLARLPAYLAEPDIAAGRLVEVLADWVQPVLPLSIVFAPGRRSEAKIKAFVDFIVSEMRI
ncbi:MAG: LysR family transcriptional regulator [Sphingobium sp.]